MQVSILPVWTFCADLRERLERGEHTVDGLACAGAVYRADPLIEAVADLVDALTGHEQGRMGESVVRQGALRVATMACRLWLELPQPVQTGTEVECDGC